jgi:hypothetical protein
MENASQPLLAKYCGLSELESGSVTRFLPVADIVWWLIHSFCSCLLAFLMKLDVLAFYLYSKPIVGLSDEMTCTIIRDLPRPLAISVHWLWFGDIAHHLQKLTYTYQCNATGKFQSIPFNFFFEKCGIQHWKRNSMLCAVRSITTLPNDNG